MKIAHIKVRPSPPQPAQGQIDRLTQVIQTADEGAAATNTAARELQTANLTERDLESQQLRRALEEQQTETESLREALSQTRTSLHERLRELEDVLCLRHAEVGSSYKSLQDPAKLFAATAIAEKQSICCSPTLERTC